MGQPIRKADPRKENQKTNAARTIHPYSIPNAGGANCQLFAGPTLPSYPIY